MVDGVLSDIHNHRRPGVSRQARYMATEKFTVDKHIIQHLISSQAGSVEKAILESAMNSIDAGARGIDIRIDAKGKTLFVSDDGRGWKDADEIRTTFGTFGFDHGEDNRRTYGQFGLGRGQLWNYCRATYRTNGFALDVDIRERGLEYDIREADHRPGCLIEGEFYEPLDPRDIQTAARTLKEWLEYAGIPICFNGEAISTDPAKQSWDQATDEAYFKFRDQSSLLIYNQGIFVGRVSAYEFGIGGAVVSRKPLSLNMARNDVLRAQCKVWPKIRDCLRTAAGLKAKTRRERLDDYSRCMLIRDWMAGDIPYAEICDQAVLVDGRGRARKLNAVTGFKRVAIADKRGSNVADKLLASKMALVLAPEIAEWFGVKDGQGLVSAIKQRINEERTPLGRAENEAEWDAWHEHRKLDQRWRDMQGVDWESLRAEYDFTHEIVADKDLTRRQKAQLMAVKALNDGVAGEIASIRRKVRHARTLRAGRSESAAAWTDGESYVAVDLDTAANACRGVEGLTRMAKILLHEYVHDSSSADDTHTHSQAFYEDFHDLLTHPEWRERNMVDCAIRQYRKALARYDLKVPRWVATEGRVVDDEEDIAAPA